MAERTEKKRRHWSLRVLEVIFLIATIAVLVYFWPARFGGSTTFVIVGGHSMEPTYDIGDIVVLRKGDPKIGDVVAVDVGLNGGNPPLVIHRIVGGDPNGWVLQGDNNPNIDPWEPTSADVAGIAEYRLPGAIRALNLIRQPLFYAILAGIAAIVLLWPRKKPEEQLDSDDEPPDPTVPTPPPAEVVDDQRAASAVQDAKPASESTPEERDGSAGPKTTRKTPKKALVVTAMGVLIAFSLVGASASHLTVQADDLMAEMIPGDRCDDVISVEPLTVIDDALLYDRIELTDVDAACDGLQAQIVVKDEDGNELATGTATATTSTFIVEFSPDVSVFDYDGIALAINGWGIPTVPVGELVTSTPNITSDWGPGYCAEVTVSTTSPVPVPWTSTLDLSDWPLNGTPYEVNNANWTFEAPVFYATPMFYNPTVVLGSPVVWSYCAERPLPPPDPAEWVMTMNNDWGGGYCAKIVVSTESIIPITWNIEVPLDTYPFTPTPYEVSNASWSFSSPVLFASGVGWNNTVVAGQPRELQLCANRPGNTPVPQSLSPSALAQGATNMNITISGYNFENGATVSFSGTGITVNSVNFVGSWQLIANVTVAPNAALGLRDIFVTNPGNVMGGKSNLFTVTG